ncbi:hypothetical protein BH23GEM9_BH23GEM9_11920 [soil metagenome]
MKLFHDENGGEWVASAREEHTPRHHGRWFLVFHPAADDGSLFSMPEVRWQTHRTAERTLRSMSDFELRRRLHTVRERALLEFGASPTDGALPPARQRSSADAG